MSEPTPDTCDATPLDDLDVSLYYLDRAAKRLPEGEPSLRYAAEQALEWAEFLRSCLTQPEPAAASPRQ